VTTVLRDYTHARKLFIDGNYRLMPKYAFLFYVAFDINASVTSLPSSQIFEAGLLVRTVSLPKFQIENKVLNAYNRNNVAQFKIKYMPAEITFHDDTADVVNQFWFDYYNFYYRDSDHQDSSFRTPYKYSAMNSVVGSNWGYNLRTNVDSSSGIANQYINAIRIYSLNQGKFTEYVLENPTIVEFNHGEHDQSDTSGLLKNTMRVAYETVTYASGTISDGGDPGFVTAQYYDSTPSPLPTGSAAPTSATTVVWTAGVSQMQTPAATNATGVTGGLSLSQLGSAILSSSGNSGLTIPTVSGMTGSAASLSGLAVLPSVAQAPAAGGASLASLASSTIAVAQSVQGVAMTAQQLIGAARYISSTVQNASTPLQALAAVSNGVAVGASAVGQASGAIGAAVSTVAQVTGGTPIAGIGTAVSAINQTAQAAVALNNVAAPALNAAAALTAVSQANNPMIAVQQAAAAAGSVAQAASGVVAATVSMNQAASALKSLTTNQGSL
jgi:hypothetical protein